MPDHAVPLGAFAKAVGLTERHVRRLIAAGLPVAVTNGSRGPHIPLAAGRAWIAKTRRARIGGPAVAGRLALLNVQTAGSRTRERTHRTRYIHEADWAPAWRAQVAAVRAVLDEWRVTAPARILEILRPGGPRLFPGEDPRAIGYAIAEHVAQPLLHQLADRMGALPALPGAGARGGAPGRPPRSSTRSGASWKPGPRSWPCGSRSRPIPAGVHAARCRRRSARPSRPLRPK